MHTSKRQRHPLPHPLLWIAARPIRFTPNVVKRGIHAPVEVTVLVNGYA